MKLRSSCPALLLQADEPEDESMQSTASDRGLELSERCIARRCRDREGSSWTREHREDCKRKEELRRQTSLFSVSSLFWRSPLPAASPACFHPSVVPWRRRGCQCPAVFPLSPLRAGARLSPPGPDGESTVSAATARRPQEEGSPAAAAAAD
jgi:hypothetical protein